MGKRRFRIYLSHGYAECPPEEVFLDFDGDAADTEIERDCRAAFEALIQNMDGGWYEVGTQGGKDGS